MPRHVRAPKTIAEQGGLEPYLDATAHLHNGLKYRDLMNRIRSTRKHPIPKPVIGEDFGVSSQTIYSWLRIHAKEQAARDTITPSEGRP
jgi:hypothetical protein